MKTNKALMLLMAFHAASPAWGHDDCFIPDAPPASADKGSGSDWTRELPPGFPRPAVPEDNPMSPAKIELGRFLFYDKKLSGNGSMSCSSCHQQKLAFTDGKKVSVGSTRQQTARSAQPLANVAWNTTYTWANPALVSLERQMLVPLYGDSPVEMGLNDKNKASVLNRFRQNPDYQKKFAAAFRGEAEPITFNNIIKAISAFQRTIVSGDSKFDRYQNGTASLSPGEMRGKNLFFGEKAECFHCHCSFNFNDQTFHAKTRQAETPFHNTGLYNVDGKGAYPQTSQGVIEVSGKPEDMGKYRAPSLRNVAITAPYMHDGSIGSLREVVATYAAGGRNITHGPHRGDGRKNPNKSELIGQIQLSRQEQDDLLSFLNTLTDKNFLTDRRYADPFSRKKAN